MKKESERQIQIRAEMTGLLFDVSRHDRRGWRSNGLLETTNTYGLLMVLAASALIVWYVGKPGNQLTVLMSLQAIVLGGFVILASELLLATRLNSFIDFVLWQLSAWGFDDNIRPCKYVRFDIF